MSNQSVSVKVPSEEAPPADDLAANGNEGKEGEDETSTLTANGATDLSDGNKTTPGEAGAKASRPGQRLKAALEGTATRVEQGFNDLQNRVDTSLRNLSGRGDGDASGENDTKGGAGSGEADSDSTS